MSRAGKRLLGWALVAPGGVLLLGETFDPTASPLLVLLGIGGAAFGAALIYENLPRTRRAA